MKLYMKCTTDELELPLAVADSPKELAVMLKANYGTIATMVSRQICGYHKVEIEDTELYPGDLCGGIKMNVGDTIKCSNPEKMVNLMYELNHEGIETDFMYEKDGVKGLWLEVVKVN